jgi:hypothetical protein
MIDQEETICSIGDDHRVIYEHEEFGGWPARICLLQLLDGRWGGVDTCGVEGRDDSTIDEIIAEWRAELVPAGGMQG